MSEEIKLPQLLSGKDKTPVSKIKKRVYRYKDEGEE